MHKNCQQVFLPLTYQTDQLRAKNAALEKELASLHRDVDAAVGGAEQAETLMKKEILQVNTASICSRTS